MQALPKKAEVDQAQAKKASPWLDEYVKYSLRYSPQSFHGFHEACGLWILSTVAGRRLHMPDFGPGHYANLYILMAAKSGQYVKTVAARAATRVLKDCNLRWTLAPDEITPQALIRHLSGIVPSNYNNLFEEDKEWHRRRLAMRGARGWFYDEFGGKISQMVREGGHMADFHSLLRRFYDCDDIYEYQTITRGSDKVYGPYLALLGNITPTDMNVSGKSGGSMWSDGFWARFAFVCPPGTDGPSMERWAENEEIVVPFEVQKPLADWNARLPLPEVTIHDEEGDLWAEIDHNFEPAKMSFGEGVWDAFYNYHDSLRVLGLELEETDLASSYQRLAGMALRISMLLASLEDSKTVEMRYWARAQTIAESWREGLHNLYSQINDGETPKEKLESAVLAKVIKKGGPVKAYEIAQGVRGVDTGTASMILNNLVNAGVLRIVDNGRVPEFEVVV
jgi:hypothetical protein